MELSDKKIKKLIKKYNEKMEIYSSKLERLRRQCPHRDAEHINKANTGNYDPSCDSYWTDHLCHSCGHRWTTDQRWNRSPSGDGLKYNNTDKTWSL